MAYIVSSGNIGSKFRCKDGRDLGSSKLNRYLASVQHSDDPFLQRHRSQVILNLVAMAKSSLVNHSRTREDPTLSLGRRSKHRRSATAASSLA